MNFWRKYMGSTGIKCQFSIKCWLLKFWTAFRIYVQNIYCINIAICIYSTLWIQNSSQRTKEKWQCCPMKKIMTCVQSCQKKCLRNSLRLTVVKIPRIAFHSLFMTIWFEYMLQRLAPHINAHNKTLTFNVPFFQFLSMVFFGTLIITSSWQLNECDTKVVLIVGDKVNPVQTI